MMRCSSASVSVAESATMQMRLLSAVGYRISDAAAVGYDDDDDDDAAGDVAVVVVVVVLVLRCFFR